MWRGSIPELKFIHLSQLAEFMRGGHGFVNWPMVLVTDNFCDHTVSQEGNSVIIRHSVTGSALEGFDLPLDDKIAYWFGQNLNLNIPGRTSPQFIGVLNTKQYFDFVEKHPAFVKKTGLCYMNFGFTLPARIYWYEILRRMPFITDGIHGILHNQTMDYFTVKMYRFFFDTASHHYAIVPPGQGIDSFRLYETLLMRTIPIVIGLPYYQHYKDWPVLIVNDYSELTEKLLQDRLEELDARFDSFYHRLSREAIVEEISTKAAEVQKKL